MANKSAFFKTKPCVGTSYSKTGLSLITRPGVIGSIVACRETGKFMVTVVNAKDKLFMEEFATFPEADRFAWISWTSI